MLNIPSPIQVLELPLLKEKGLNLYVKRDDLIHDLISGNKWRKMKYNIDKAKHKNYDGILTFGGAHSNHIIATAFLCKHNQLKSIGIIRGDAHVEKSNTLNKCEELDMELSFVSRGDYKEKDSAQYIEKLQLAYPNYLILPEGGANEAGVKGCEDIVAEIDVDFDFVTVDCGTGATLAGMVRELKPHQKAIGVQVLKGRDFISEEVLKFSPNTAEKFEVWTEYHFGGYAKYKDELLDFMRWFCKETGIKLDPIYTGKQFFAVFDQIDKGYFPRGTNIVLTHTGGLQGIEGFEKRYGVRIY